MMFPKKFQLSEAIEEQDDDTLKKMLLAGNINTSKEYDCLYCFNNDDIDYISHFVLKNPHEHSPYLIRDVLRILPFKHAVMFASKIQEQQPEWLTLGSRFFTSMHMNVQEYEAAKELLSALKITMVDMLVGHGNFHSKKLPHGQIRWFCDIFWRDFALYHVHIEHMFSGEYRHKNLLTRPFLLLLYADEPKNEQEKIFLNLMSIDPMLAKATYDNHEVIIIVEEDLHL